MKLAAGVLLALTAAASPSPEPRYFRFERPIQVPAGRAGQACFVLDETVFAHAAPGLSDLRLYRDGAESPYVVRMAAPVDVPEKSVPILNLGRRGGGRGGQTVFDAAMPIGGDGKYSDVVLDITGENFIATITVSGSQIGGAETTLGAYTVFDLSRQKLGRSTILHLPESDFAYLHFSVDGPLAPESITGLSIARLPSAEPTSMSFVND